MTKRLNRQVSMEGMLRHLDELPLPQRNFYLDGYRAFCAGFPLAENPWPIKTYAGTLWDEGWADADDDARIDA